MPLCSFSANIEEAAKAVGVSHKTLLRWMKVPEFDEAYRKARRQAFGQAIARLQQGSSAAATTLLKIMLDQNSPASTRVRAAECVMNQGIRAIEMEDLEARIVVLEGSAEKEKR